MLFREQFYDSDPHRLLALQMILWAKLDVIRINKRIRRKRVILRECRYSDATKYKTNRIQLKNLVKKKRDLILSIEGDTFAGLCTSLGLNRELTIEAIKCPGRVTVKGLTLDDNEL